MQVNVCAGLALLQRVMFRRQPQLPHLRWLSSGAPPPTEGKFMVQMGGDPGMVDYKNVSLKTLIAGPEMKDYQVSGPDCRLGALDVVAKIPPNTPPGQVPLMLQTLLAERFKLTAHRQQKVMPVYAMVVGKNGPKLKPVEGEPGCRMRMSIGPRGRQVSGPTTMSALAGSLSQMLDRPVVDLTELKGTYDIDLEWVPDEREGGGMMAKMKAMAEAASTDPHGTVGPQWVVPLRSASGQAGTKNGGPQESSRYRRGGQRAPGPHRELTAREILPNQIEPQFVIH
jgi:uncharacterized protein (TIGR03435 family)